MCKLFPLYKLRPILNKFVIEKYYVSQYYVHIIELYVCCQQHISYFKLSLKCLRLNLLLISYICNYIYIITKFFSFGSKYKIHILFSLGSKMTFLIVFQKNTLKIILLIAVDFIILSRKIMNLTLPSFYIKTYSIILCYHDAIN